MDPRVAPLAAILDLNTELLLNCVDGLTDTEARERLAGGGNSITFLAAHLTESRHFLAGRLGHPLDNPLAPYLADARRLEEIREWPSLEQVRVAWRTVAPHVRAALDAAAEPELTRPGEHRFPIGDATQLGLIAFLVQHDSYHIGQLAFLRRQLGHPAMTYPRPAASTSEGRP